MVWRARKKNVRKRTTKKPRKYARRRAANTIVPRISTSRLGYPRDVVRILHYNDTFTLTSTGGALYEYLFRANSCYDPNLSGTGHQPYGFDQLAAFYNHYDVLSSVANITAVPTTISTGVSTVVGCYIADDSTAYTDYGTYIEARRGTYRITPPTNVGVAPVRFKSIFSAKKFFSRSRDKGETTAIVTANPTEEAIFHVWAQSSDRVSTGNQITFNINISFKVRFFEPKDIPAS